jgi:hypothetical protein
MVMTVANTQLEYSSPDLRNAATQTQAAKAGRRTLPIASVPERWSREAAAETSEQDPREVFKSEGDSHRNSSLGSMLATDVQPND